MKRSIAALWCQTVTTEVAHGTVAERIYQSWILRKLVESTSGVYCPIRGGMTMYGSSETVSLCAIVRLTSKHASTKKQQHLLHFGDLGAFPNRRSKLLSPQSTVMAASPSPDWPERCSSCCYCPQLRPNVSSACYRDLASTACVKLSHSWHLQVVLLMDQA